MSYREPYRERQGNLKSKTEIQTLKKGERIKLAAELLADGLIAFYGLEEAGENNDIKYNQAVAENQEVR